ncbi:MAG TPA: hypothetical protein VKE74_00840, partial [Gemmataceae bacterium]|nr:hypothetical protein [Gemmataceae bacterium]
WLADPKGATEDARKGPLALEVREPYSTTFTKGIVTLLPASSIRSIHYEYEKQLMSVAVNGLNDPISGTLQYRGINVIALEGDAGGVPAKFTGGAPGTGIKKVVFSGSKPLAVRPSGGAAWAVQITQPQANNPTLPARNLKPLFAFPGGVEMLLDAIPVRKGDPLGLTGAGVKRVEVLAVDPNTQMAALEVQPDDGPERVVVIPLTLEQDKRTGTLLGLLGEVDAGWKLFPLHTIKVITSDTKK